MAEIERKSKGIDAPKCKVCNTRHWGVCTDQSGGGYLTAQRDRPAPAERLAAAKAIVARPPVTKRKNGKKRT